MCPASLPRFLPLGLLPIGLFALACGFAPQASADPAWREADRARREMQRQQRVTECQNRVLAQQGRYPTAAEFLAARQACSAAR